MTPNAYTALAVLLLLCLAILAGCGTTGHVGVMHEFGRDTDTSGQNPLCTAEIRKALNSRVSAKYFDQSWCSSGIPFNDNAESTTDAVGVEIKLW